MAIHEQRAYVLITAARNEESYITGTIESVLAQTVRPLKWVIVSDGSTDGTDEIVNKYALRYNFIDFQKREHAGADSGFISKALALKQGYLRLKDVQYQYVGILDADITFAPTYYEEMLARFAANARLGIGGGFIYESRSGSFQSRHSNAVYSVAGAIQLFRRACYEAIGGIRAMRAGGEDWLAEIDARMTGWEVSAFPEFVVYHHKQGLSARGVVRDSIRAGVMDYVVGSHPFFEILKCINRFKLRPFVIYGLLRMFGYTLSWLRQEERAVTPPVLAFLRAWQLNRIKDSLKGRGPVRS